VAIYSRSTKSAVEAAEKAKEFEGLCAEAFATYSDEQSHQNLDDLLLRKDVISVIVALPTLVQPAVVLKCLAAGKHVLMEKPIAKDVQEAVALVKEYEAKYKSKKLVLSVAEQFRFNPGYEKARQLIANGSIGKVMTVHGRVWQGVKAGNKWYETPWRKTPEYQGGFLLDGGVHFVALIRHISSDDIVETSSFAKQTWSHLPPLDTVQAALRFESGALGSLSMSFASVKGDYSFVFIGSKGSITITSKEGGVNILLEDGENKFVSEDNVKGDGTLQEFQAFFKAVYSGSSTKQASPWEALTDVAVVESLCEGGGMVEKYN
jgi:predicted dehydrogenase